MRVVFMAMVIVLMGVSSAAEAEGPAPIPTSDATTVFVPAMFASLAALAFGILF